MVESENLTTTTTQDEDITFKLQLNCIARKSSKIQTLRLNPFSPSVQDIKKAIENEFSIPTCVQTLRYQSMTLPDEGSLLDACGYVRMGDVLTVDYICEADVKQINTIIAWIRRVNRATKEEKNLPDSIGLATETIILEGSSNNYEYILAVEIFKWQDAKGHVNKIFFQESGGLEELVALYKSILIWEWGEMWQTFRFLEIFCSRAFAGFGETLHFRRVLLRHDAMRMAMQSILRLKMEIQGSVVIEEVDDRWSDEYSTYALKAVLEYSLHTICKCVL